MQILNLEEKKEAILLLMEYAVNPEDMAKAIDLVEKHSSDHLALNIFHEFYSFLPEAENDAIKILRNLESREGSFIIAVTTNADDYLYLATTEGAEFLGTHEEGIWDEEVLNFFGYSREEAINKFIKLDEFPVYVPVHMNLDLCISCTASNGEYHRLGCPVEICPWCGGQLVHCNCRFSQAGVDQLSTERQIENFLEILNEKGRIPFSSKEQRLSFAKS